MQRADRHRLAQPERERVPDQALPAGVVDLVGDDEDWAARPAADDLCYTSILVGDARDRVDHDQADVSVGDGLLALLADLAVERVATRAPAAGVDEPELAARPLGVDHLAVAGDAWPLLHDGCPLPQYAVDQRRLAHVGPTDDSDDGKLSGQ